MIFVRKAAFASTGILAFLLAGCGGGGGVNSTGGGGGGGGSSPSYTKFNDLTGDQTFQTAGVQISLGAPANSVVRPYGQGLTARYFVSSDEVEVQNFGKTYRFGAADYDAQLSNATNDVFSKPDGTTLAVGVPQVRGVSLSYTRFGSLVYFEGMPFQDLVVFGVGTKPGDMPKSGSATYSTALFGAVSDSSGPYELSKGGSATFSANFGTGAVETGIALKGTHVQNGTLKDFGSIQGSGTIASGSAGFSGTFANVNGGFAGGFFGPGASEMGYAFGATGADWSAVGHVAGRK